MEGYEDAIKRIEAIGEQLEKGEANPTRAFSKLGEALQHSAKIIAAFGPVLAAAQAALKQQQEIEECERRLEAYGIERKGYSAEDFANFFGPVLAAGRYIELNPVQADIMSRWFDIKHEGPCETCEPDTAPNCTEESQEACPFCKGTGLSECDGVPTTCCDCEAGDRLRRADSNDC